jgi:hypothetical protein
VSNWSISRNYKNIWNSTKDSVTIGMFVTRRHVGPNHKSNGLKGQPGGPTPWSAGHTLIRFRPRLGGYILTSVHMSILCARVSENREEWPVDHVDGCPTVHHLHTDSIKSVEAPLDLYIRILTVEFTHTTLFL